MMKWKGCTYQGRLTWQQQTDNSTTHHNSKQQLVPHQCSLDVLIYRICPFSACKSLPLAANCCCVGYCGSYLRTWSTTIILSTLQLPAVPLDSPQLCRYQSCAAAADAIPDPCSQPMPDGHQSTQPQSARQHFRSLSPVRCKITPTPALSAV